VASLKAPWSAAAREAARVILSRIAAEEEARVTREVRAAIDGPDESLAREAEERFGAILLARDAAGELRFGAPAQSVADLADWLIGRGARQVTSAKLDYVFRADNGLWRRLEKRLPAS